MADPEPTAPAPDVLPVDAPPEAPAPTPAVVHATVTEPIGQTVALDPVLPEPAPTSAEQTNVPGFVLNTTAPDPVVHATAASPFVQTTAPDPVVDTPAPAPAVQMSAPDRVVHTSAPAPVVHVTMTEPVLATDAGRAPAITRIGGLLGVVGTCVAMLLFLIACFGADHVGQHRILPANWLAAAWMIPVGLGAFGLLVSILGGLIEWRRSPEETALLGAVFACALSLLFGAFEMAVSSGTWHPAGR